MIGAGRGGACQSARKKRQNGERRLPRLRRRKRFSPFSVAGDRVFLSARKSLFSCFLFSTLYCFLCGRPGGLSCAAQSRLCRLCPALRARVSIPDAVVCCDRSGHAPLSRRYLRSPHPGKCRNVRGNAVSRTRSASLRRSLLILMSGTFSRL